MGRLALHRRHRDDSTGARTALVLLTMVVSDDQLAQCERSLVWCAANRPTTADFNAALGELRDASQAREVT